MVCSTGTVPPSGSSFSATCRAGSRRSTRRSATAGGSSQLASLRKSSKPGSVTSAVTTALGGSPGCLVERRSSVVVPGAHAADLQVAALGEAERVVELDLVGLALGALLGRAGEHERAAAHDAEHRERSSSDAPHFGRPRRAVGLVAVERLALVRGPDVRAVGRGRLGGARAALVLLGAASDVARSGG